MALRPPLAPRVPAALEPLDPAALRRVSVDQARLTGATLSEASLRDVTLTGCRLDGVRSVRDLRGATMPWPDIVANAGLFAAAAGVRLSED